MQLKWIRAQRRDEPAWLGEERRARLVAGALWALVGVAAISGIAAFVRPVPPPASGGPAGPEPGEVTSASWAAAGFAERFVAAYLAASDGGELEEFLGYSPELRPSVDDGARSAPPVVRAVAVEPLGGGYWAVTVAAGAGWWRVGVTEASGWVASGLPAPVAGPAAATERVDLSVPLMETPPADDTAVDTMAGFLAAYACGAGELSRYLRPGVVVAAVEPAVCTEVELTRWGAAPGASESAQTVVVDAVLDPRESARTVTYVAELSMRGGRWEIAGLLAAPPLEQT